MKLLSKSKDIVSQHIDPHLSFIMSVKAHKQNVIGKNVSSTTFMSRHHFRIFHFQFSFAFDSFSLLRLFNTRFIIVDEKFLSGKTPTNHHVTSYLFFLSIRESLFSVLFNNFCVSFKWKTFTVFIPSLRERNEVFFLRDSDTLFNLIAGTSSFIMSMNAVASFFLMRF